MKFFVSRQKYFGVDEKIGTVVEVASGGVDLANPDMLTTRWAILGEGQEFYDPRDAVECAIKVCEAWKTDGGEKNAKVVFGATGGFTLPFEPKSYKALRKHAEEMYETLPKCDQCGEVLKKEKFSHNFAHPDQEFCSISCAEKNYESISDVDG